MLTRGALTTAAGSSSLEQVCAVSSWQAIHSGGLPVLTQEVRREPGKIRCLVLPPRCRLLRILWKLAAILGTIRPHGPEEAILAVSQSPRHQPRCPQIPNAVPHWWGSWWVVSEGEGQMLTPHRRECALQQSSADAPSNGCSQPLQET